MRKIVLKLIGLNGDESEKEVAIGVNQSLRFDEDGEPVISEEPQVYHALLTQTGEADPVVTVLKNTLRHPSGAVEMVWPRQSAGLYYGRANVNGVAQQLFPAAKTGILWQQPTPDSFFGHSSTSLLIIDTLDAEGTPADGLLTKTFMQILVYPS